MRWLLLVGGMLVVSGVVCMVAATRYSQEASGWDDMAYRETPLVGVNSREEAATMGKQADVQRAQCATAAFILGPAGLLLVAWSIVGSILGGRQKNRPRGNAIEESDKATVSKAEAADPGSGGFD